MGSHECFYAFACHRRGRFRVVNSVGASVWVCCEHLDLSLAHGWKAWHDPSPWWKRALKLIGL